MATALLLLCHIPPALASLKNNTVPAQASELPTIAPGNGLTVTSAFAIQPVATLYVMIVVPEDKLVRRAVDEPIVATAVLLLLQCPPVVTSLNAAVRPAQSTSGPVIFAGTGFTVTSVVFRHPVASEYVITAVPLPTPATIPEIEPILATAVLVLVHIPPPIASLRSISPPTQTLKVPVMVDGIGFTMKRVVVLQPPVSV